MLPEDCRRFISFLQERDPVIVGEWQSSQSPEIQDVVYPWKRARQYCIGIRQYFRHLVAKPQVDTSR
jgi:hypothetical protein